MSIHLLIIHYPLFIIQYILAYLCLGLVWVGCITGFYSHVGES